MAITRRTLIQNGIGIGVLGSLTFLKPHDIGSGHNVYFEKISQALKQANFSKPTLVIDKQRLDKNIQILKKHISDKYAYRIVVKSLPSFSLLNYISNQVGSQRFMVFDESFLLTMIENLPESDLLLGKPLPAVGANKILKQINATKGSEIRWLVDSLERLKQYQRIAQERKQTLRINLEIDIGLHRGGFSSEESFTQALNTLKQSPFLVFDGLMGYEPHVVKLPGNSQAHLADALNIYKERINLAKKILAEDFPTECIFNTAGSPSYQLHTRILTEQHPCNELSAGSCLVKPSDFDLSSLSDHQPASFIATPILKTLSQTDIPGVPGLGELMSWWNPNLKRSLFTYGGNWKAQPVSPSGLSYNPIYGRSSNQEMLNASIANPLEMDDWIFLRPSQSESVFLQFGDLALFDGEKFIERWPVIS